MNQKVDVCIVGAGPGGALLAYLLAKKNISVLLIERTNQIAKTFRGEHINEEGEMILKKHGLFDKVAKLGLLKMERLEYWLDGQLAKTITPNPAVGHLGIHVPQGHLLQAIMEAAQAYDTFEYRLNSRVTELLQDTSGRYNGVRAICNGEEFVVNCQISRWGGWSLFHCSKKGEYRHNNPKAWLRFTMGPYSRTCWMVAIY